MRREIAAAAVLLVAGASLASAQSRAHNNARVYAEILGRSVWCDISRDERRAYERLAMKAIDADSFNDPESGAAQLMFKSVLAETARMNTRNDCPAIEDAFKRSYETLQASPSTPRCHPHPASKKLDRSASRPVNLA